MCWLDSDGCGYTAAALTMYHGDNDRNSQLPAKYDVYLNQRTSFSKRSTGSEKYNTSRLSNFFLVP